MGMKYFGAALVILGCGGFGFAMAAAHRREERQLQHLYDILGVISRELQFRLSPLPMLCREAGNLGNGPVYAVFSNLARKLEDRTQPEVSACLYTAAQQADLMPSVRELLHNLGASLGRFDLDGQLDGILLVRQRCSQVMEQLTRNRDDRLRSYQTLGICAGTALVILFA